MNRKGLSLLLLIGIAIITGGIFVFKKVLVLELENMDLPQTIHIRIGSHETFSMFYIHSIYSEPVFEEFQAEGDTIVLKGVRTKSPAVMEYYGFEEAKEFHPMNLRLGSIYLKWGMGKGQALMVRDKKIFLSEIGQSGNRIQLRIESVSLGEYLLGRLKQNRAKNI